jgi:hypothetical protein
VKTNNNLLTADFLEVLAFIARHLKRRKVVTITPTGACWECVWREAGR